MRRIILELSVSALLPSNFIRETLFNQHRLYN